MTWVWENSAAAGIDRLVLLAIADSATDDGGNAWPSVALLCRKAVVDRRTVQRSIRRLMDSGELSMKKNAGRNGVNVYRVVMTSGAAERRSGVAPQGHSATGTAPPRQNAAAAEMQKRGGTAPHEPSLNHPSETSLRSVSPARPTKSEIVAAFEEFWATYPRRTGKRGAQTEFERATKRAPLDVILGGAKRYSDDPNREDGYTKHPSTWLHQDCWDDDPLPPRGSPRRGEDTDALFHRAMERAKVRDGS